MYIFDIQNSYNKGEYDKAMKNINKKKNKKFCEFY